MGKGAEAEIKGRLGWVVLNNITTPQSIDWNTNTSFGKYNFETNFKLIY